MIQNILVELFQRDLKKLKEEILLFKREEDLWVTKGGINNSAGNLAMHLVGNLNHFVGATLGDTSYIRDRNFEFNGKISRKELVVAIEDTVKMVKVKLPQFTNEFLEEEFPIRVFDRSHSNQHFLMHLSTHLSYHLGQINYLRRVLER